MCLPALDHRSILGYLDFDPLIVVIGHEVCLFAGRLLTQVHQAFEVRLPRRTWREQDEYRRRLPGFVSKPVKTARRRVRVITRSGIDPPIAGEDPDRSVEHVERL